MIPSKTAVDNTLTKVLFSRDRTAGKNDELTYTFTAVGDYSYNCGDIQHGNGEIIVRSQSWTLSRVDASHFHPRHMHPRMSVWLGATPHRLNSRPPVSSDRSVQGFATTASSRPGRTTASGWRAGRASTSTAVTAAAGSWTNTTGNAGRELPGFLPPWPPSYPPN